jgi:hypothetical protein
MPTPGIDTCAETDADGAPVAEGATCAETDADGAEGATCAETEAEGALAAGGDTCAETDTVGGLGAGARPWGGWVAWGVEAAGTVAGAGDTGPTVGNTALGLPELVGGTLRVWIAFDGGRSVGVPA